MGKLHTGQPFCPAPSGPVKPGRQPKHPALVIMAGGKGTRIATVAADIPKPMIKICGKPKKGYSGTAIFTRKQPLSVQMGIGVEEHDHEGRVIALEFDRFFLVTVYTPNSQRGLTRLEYRMTWEDAFADYLCGLDKQKPVVVCGDMNVAHKEIDLKNPKTNTQNAGFTPQEREKMTALLERGFVDTFRLLHPDERDRYSWWSYMQRSRERNIGWRIDYFLVSERIAPNVTLADIDEKVMGSDHCPVILELKGME